MQATIITGKERLEVIEVPEPEPRPGAAVVDIGLCGICGSDVSAYKSGMPYPPMLCGHEWFGNVTAVGSDVKGIAEGDRVVMAIPPACGSCGPCLAGHSHRCEQYMKMAFGLHPLTPPHGGYAPRIAVPHEALVPIPAALPATQAAQIEPSTVALHAVRRRPPRVGDTVVVIGAGPIGLLTAQIAGIAGAGRVVMVEPRESRRALALKLGIDAAYAPGDELSTALHELTHGLGADVVYECAGSDASLASAFQHVRPGGTVMMVGVASRPVTIDTTPWLIKEAIVDSSFAHLHHEFLITIDLLTDGRLQVEPLHDLTIGLAGLPDAFADLAAGSDHVKVLVDPDL